MNLKERLADLFNAKITFTEALGILVCLGLLIPFFILAYFDYPTLDDFSFALKSIAHGYWGGQVSAYQDWNGRYFASAILLAHPLVIHSFALYKIIPVFLLSLTTYSVYYFIRVCFSQIKKINCFIFSVLLVFYFLDQMPTLVQGIYWAPAAITYQLANCMMLFLCAFLVCAVSMPEKLSRWKKISGALLVLAVVGSNETSMLIIDLMLASFMLYYIITERKINKLILVYILLALAGSIVVFLSPGNAIREIGFQGKHDIWFTIRSSFTEGTKCIYGWIFTGQNIMFSILVISACIIRGKTSLSPGRILFLFLFILILGYLILCATFAASFWTTVAFPVDRTVNTIYWLFVLLWSCLLYFAANYIISKISFLSGRNFRPVFIISAILFLITLKASGNYYNACNDLVSGKASVYKKEYLSRVKKMEASPANVVIGIPTYTMFPKSLFIVDDIQENSRNWNTIEYLKYFKKSFAEPINVEPYYSCKYLLSYDTESDMKMKNSNHITHDRFFSSPNSTFIEGPDSYSTIFEKKMKDIDIDNPSQISNIALSAEIFSDDSLINAVIVITVLRPEGESPKLLYWSGINLDKNNCPTNKWNKESMIFPITSNTILNPDNRLMVYLWNKSKGNARVYMDDLLIKIY